MPKKQKAAEAGRAGGEKSVAWAAGTGYGYGSRTSEVWDAKRAAVVQVGRLGVGQGVLACRLLGGLSLRDPRHLGPAVCASLVDVKAGKRE